MATHERITVPALFLAACLNEECAHEGAGDCPTVDSDVCEVCTLGVGEPDRLVPVVPWPCEPSRRERLTVVR